MAQARLFGIWQQIAQFAISRLTQEPGPLVKIAFALLKGRLAPLPEHIVLSARLQNLNHRVLAHAISPNGKIAILMARDEITCGLVTWSQEEGLREQNLDNLWHYTEELPMGILFPHGSEDPLVYYGEDHEDGNLHHIHWGDFHYQIQKSTKVFKIEAWIMDEARNIVLTTDDGWTYCEKGKDERKWQTQHIKLWVGCIDGHFAGLGRIYGKQALYWHGGEIVMPNESHEIDVNSICSATNVGVWFVSRTKDQKVEYLWWSDGKETKCTENDGESVSREGILLIRPESGKVFVEDSFHPLKMHEHVLFQDNTSGAESEAQITSPLWRVILRPGSYPFCKLGVFAGKRARGPRTITRGKIINRAMLLQDHWKDELLVYALAQGVRTKIFPMYGEYFPTLAVVGPHHQREILGFMLVDSTLHIVRYRLW